MKIEPIHEIFEPPLSSNWSDSSSTLSSRRALKTVNHQTTSDKTSFDTKDSFISSKISNKQINYRYQKSVDNHQLLLSTSLQEPNVKTVEISKVKDVNEFGDIIDDNTNGKLYLFEKLFNCEKERKKQFSVHESRSTTANNFYYDDVEDESNSLVSTVDDCVSGSKVLCENTDVPCNDDTDKSWLLRTTKIGNGNRRVKKKKILSTKSPNKNVKKKTSVKNYDNRQPQWDCDPSSVKQFAKVMPIANTKQVIKDVYKTNKNVPEVKERNNVRRDHIASSLINRNKKSKEIDRINKIISNNLINVRSTIPKMKR